MGCIAECTLHHPYRFLVFGTDTRKSRPAAKRSSFRLSRCHRSGPNTRRATVLLRHHLHFRFVARREWHSTSAWHSAWWTFASGQLVANAAGQEYCLPDIMMFCSCPFPAGPNTGDLSRFSINFTTFSMCAPGHISVRACYRSPRIVLRVTKWYIAPAGLNQLLFRPKSSQLAGSLGSPEGCNGVVVVAIVS